LGGRLCRLRHHQAAPGRGRDAAWLALREYFSENEIVEPGYTIAAIRGWNVLNLSLRNQIPVHPAPGM